MKKEKKELLIGAHMSIEGGLEKALIKAQELEATVLQLFTKSNRQWYAKPLTQEAINLFKQTRKEIPFHSITAHASYLINLASVNSETRKKAITALKSELHRCDQLGIEFLVLHPGSHGKQGTEKGIELVAHGINTALDSYKGNTKLLIETMAGQGTSLGSTFEEIANIRSLCKNKVDVCLDTCHIFAAGYDMSTKDQYEKTMQTFDEIIGFDNLKVIHVNDSKKECGCRVDRHEDIGAGKIGKEGFKLLFNDPRFFNVPKILETPKESLADDKRNIATIKSLITWQ